MERIPFLAALLEQERRVWLRGSFQALGLPVGQGQPRTMVCLLEQGPQSQVRLAEACALEVSTLSRGIDRLVEAGLVRREAAPDCRRSSRISLTPEGREMARQVAEIFSRCEAALTADFTPEERVLLAQFLRRGRENLRRFPAGTDENREQTEQIR